MAMQQGTTGETLTGLVEATNPKGIKVAGQWVNFSRFGNVPRPDQGQMVTLTVKDGFIKTLEVLDSSHTAAAPDPWGESAPRPSAPSKDIQIARAVALKGAIDFATSRGEMKSSDVTRLAEVWEGWLLR